MFVGRREDGTIYGVWAVRQWKGQEELAQDHPELVAFQGAQAAKMAAAGKPSSIADQICALPADELARVKKALG